MTYQEANDEGPNLSLISSQAASRPRGRAVIESQIG